ncbi:MAG TPA: metalloregulator ArsR/SmtB family transcription factor [Burkholderiales bacterium]|nr:metalloregulator ArsR/SmtB family transcription factor [Burkholderiales bacterium]
MERPEAMPAIPSTIDLSAMQRSAENACRLMKALANPDRLMVLCELTQGERSVGELEQALGIRQPTLSQQLTVLREEQLVATRREGKHIFYSVRSAAALAVLRVLYAQFCAPGKGASR